MNQSRRLNVIDSVGDAIALITAKFIINQGHKQIIEKFCTLFIINQGHKQIIEKLRITNADLFKIYLLSFICNLHDCRWLQVRNTYTEYLLIEIFQSNIFFS